MTARPAEQPVVEPSWCTGKHEISHTLPLHQSQVHKVGPEPEHTGDGVASIWLQSGRNGPPRLGLRVAHMASAGITLSIADAKRLRDLLTRAVDRAEAG